MPIHRFHGNNVAITLRRDEPTRAALSSTIATLHTETIANVDPCHLRRRDR